MDIKQVTVDVLNHGNYKFLVEEFTKETIENRFKTIYNFINSFIENNHLQEDVIISVDLLNNMIIDYFSDIYRIKEFQDIERTNFAKIYSYTAYWLLRRKVIQLKKEVYEDKLSFVNEEMVTTYICSYLFETNVFILDSQQEQFAEFQKNLLYSLIYRTYSPQSIESMIYAFKAGMSYQYSIDFAESVKDEGTES